ncbi:MAG: TlyA family RNA methyltransferase [Actinomycetota bacterium]
MSSAASASFVSRGGSKLDSALRALAIDPTGLRALDAGASTGGFTDCLLQRGASHVFAVDVAYGQFSWRLRNDSRVTVLERTNVRSLSLDLIGERVGIVVADLSFISLRTVRDALLAVLADDGQMILMVKPQFELERGSIPRGGVVRDHADWLRAVTSVVDSYRAAGCILHGAAPSALTGPKGNREFFVHLIRSGIDIGNAALVRAIEEAP